MSQTNPFPNRYEMKCSGCSFICAQLLILVAVFMYSIDYDVYSVNTEEEVLTLHNLLSSKEYRSRMEIAASAIWLSYPFLLIGLFGIKKLMLSLYAGTNGEMFIFTAVQSYIVFITINSIIIPAIVLTTSAFEWSFHEYTHEPDFIPTGYYIQLYLVIFSNEIVDCMAVSDAVFMISLVILPRFILKDTAKFKKLKSVMDPSLPNCLKNMQCLMKFYNITIIAFVLILFILFCVVLFEFAESGFFSPSGKAKFLMIVSFVLKIIMGLKIAVLGCSKRYDAVKQIFDDEGQSMLSGGDGNYKMEQVVGTDHDDKKGNDNESHEDEL